MGIAKPGATCCQSKDLILLKSQITLVTIGHVLQSLLPLTTFLQAKQCDLVEAAKEAVTVISQLQQERANPAWSNALQEGTVALAAKFEVQPSNPRND